MNTIDNLIKSALETGLDCAQDIAHQVHEQYKGYKPHRHVAVDADVAQIKAALEALAAQQCNADPSCTTVALSEMILSDCGCSSNNTALVSRVANRIDAHMQAAPPVREPLSDKQISKLWSDAHNDTTDRMAFQVLAKAIERAHGIGGER